MGVDVDGDGDVDEDWNEDVGEDGDEDVDEDEDGDWDEGEMSAYQRNKGYGFERTIAAKLRELGFATRRGGQSWRDDPNGYAGKEPDVVIEDAQLSYLWIECKVGARPNIWAAMDQACKDAPVGKVPVVIAHKDRARTLVCFELEDWLEMIRKERDNG